MVGKQTLGTRVGKYKFGPGPVNTNWWPGPGAKEKTGGRGPGNTNTMVSRLKLVHFF